MSTIIAGSQLDNAKLAQLRQTLKRDLLELARGTSGGADLIIRELRPTDFTGSDAPVGAVLSPAYVANTFASVTSNWTRLTNQQAVGIYGIAVQPATALAIGGVPNLDEIRFSAGPSVLAYLPVASAWAEQDEARVYWNPPFTWQAAEHVGIDVMSHTAKAAGFETLIFYGYVAEPETTVSKPRALLPGNGQSGGQPRVPGGI